MSERSSLTRRKLLNTAAMASAASVLSGNIVAQAQTSAPRPPADNEVLIRDAFIISMDAAIGDLAHGDIHVRDGAIVAVGANLSAPGAQVIDGRDLIACPGLIETHWHMWAAVARNMAGEDKKTGYFPFSRVLGGLFSPEDNARGVRLALAEAITSGITTVHNWSHNLITPAHADAEIAVHREVGGRAPLADGY
jgi:cytosine/adenosine deaminase-related metal-dependent hydrolase